MFVVLFHSMFGLRAVELAAAEQLRATGRRVVVPDLFAGATVPGDVDAGFALMDRVGWGTIIDRARRGLASVPGEAVLGGFSMGAGVIGELWPERTDAAAVFCLHAPTRVPDGVRTGTPVQLHVATGDDRFAPVDQIAAFRESAGMTGAAASVYEYRAAGHFFTDVSLPDYSATATASTWSRVVTLLDAVS
ncbi:MAG: dienelactone hydrolase family protein [Solirubrobacteraceae bacterium]